MTHTHTISIYSTMYAYFKFMYSEETVMTNLIHKTMASVLFGIEFQMQNLNKVKFNTAGI